MDVIEPSPEQEYEAIQDEIALWEKQQAVIANELHRLRVRLSEIRARLEGSRPEDPHPQGAAPQS